MLSFPRRAKAPVAVALAGFIVLATAAPALADRIRDQQWWLNDLHVTAAWAASKGSGVTVALLDTGAYTTADLAGKLTTGPDFTRSGRHSRSRFWGIHGTAMASLIAGHGHGPRGGGGISGIAPQAKILSIRVVLENDDPLQANRAIASRQPAAIAAGIRYATNHGAQVVDLPLDPGAVTPKGGGTKAAAGGSKAERAAVAYALSKGVVLVAPAGDDGNGADRINYPAAYPGVISVGAFNRNFLKARFSSQRSYVTLTAAGDGVVAARPSGKYATLHSTTAASAIVAGVAALIRSRYPALTPAQVTAALTRSTVFRRAGGRATGSGFGAVDAARALAFAIPTQQAWPPANGPGSESGVNAAQAPAAPRARSVGATIVSDIIRLLLPVIVLVLAALLLAVLHRRKRTVKLPGVDPDPGADVLPEVMAAYSPWPSGAARAGPPAGPADGERHHTEGGAPRRSPTRQVPEQPVTVGGSRSANAADPSAPSRDPLPWQGSIRPPIVPGGPPWPPAPKPVGEPPPPRSAPNE